MSRFSPPRPVRALGAAVFAGLIFLFGVADPIRAQTADDDLEIGGTATPTEAPMPPLADLIATLSVDVGWSIFTGDDMRRTYDGLPWVAVSADFALGPDTTVYLGAGFGRRNGDPYYDSPGAAVPDAATLSVLPLSLGLRTDWSRGARVGFLVGVGLQLIHVWERMPVFDAWHLVGADQTSTGWAKGIIVTFGPQWRSADRRRALGLDVGFGGSKGELDSRNHQHDVDLTGTHGRLYYAVRL